LIEAPDQVIVGHAISNDAIFLNKACKRYKLASIDFRFADSQKMYAEYFNVRKSISLEAAGNEFNVVPPKYLHKSDEDSQLTMSLVKNMTESLECSLEELIDLCETCSGKNENFDIRYDDLKMRIHRSCERAKSDSNNMIKKGNYRLFFKFLDGVRPQGEIIQSSLTGKTLCISINYELNHFREMLAIIQLIVNHGATYKLKASLNNIFVTYNDKDEEGNDRFCTRLKYVKEAIEQGNKIDIITFEELLAILNVQEEDLLKFPFPDESNFMVRDSLKRKEKREKKSQEHKKSKTGISLGEILVDGDISLKDLLKTKGYNVDN